MQVLFIVFLIFCVRHSIDTLDPENQPGSGKIRTGSGSRALRLTENVWHQKYGNKKEGLQNYLEFSFNSILNISYRSGNRALDPKFCQNRILIPDVKGINEKGKDVLEKKRQEGWNEPGLIADR